MMRKILFLLFALMLSGCGSSSDWKVSFPTADTFHAGKEIPVEMMISQDDKGDAGLEVTATFEMKSMDHDTIQVSFTDEGNGKYTGKTLFPMSGEWQGYITISEGNKKEEVLIPITVKE